MTDISIGDNHRDYLARAQHLGEHLAGERARLEAEYRYVLGQARRLDAELKAFLQQAYGLDAQQTPVAIDSERGMLVTPDAAPEPVEPVEPVEPEPAAVNGTKRRASGRS